LDVLPSHDRLWRDVGGREEDRAVVNNRAREENMQ